MNPREFLNLNGCFPLSPLIAALRKLHLVFAERDLPYTVIGGLAVIRNGAYRTTQDIDILTTRECWKLIRAKPPEDFEVHPDSARHVPQDIQIDILFAGDDWDMVVSLPHPSEISEYDENIGAYFISLPFLLELKTAIYLQKKDEYGVEIAAKDLSDVVALLANNADKVISPCFEVMHPVVCTEIKKIWSRVQRYGERTKS